MRDKNSNKINSLMIIKHNILNKIKRLIGRRFIRFKRNENTYDNIKRIKNDKASCSFLISQIASNESEKNDYLTKRLKYYENADIKDFNLIGDNNLEDDIFDEDIYNYKRDIGLKSNNKDNFFELYSNVRDEIVPIESLSPSDLIKFNIMLHKEIEIKKNKLISNQESDELDKKIIELEKEKELLTEKLKRIS